jgi:dynein heavy chain
VGVGGSGKQSLTRLASSIVDYKVVQIELTKSYDKFAWKEDIKRLVKLAGSPIYPVALSIHSTPLSAYTALLLALT